MNDNPLTQYTLAQLRGWADRKIISSATYVDEVERRRRAAQVEIFSAIGATGEQSTGDNP